MVGFYPGELDLPESEFPHRSQCSVFHCQVEFIDVMLGAIFYHSVLCILSLFFQIMSSVSCFFEDNESVWLLLQSVYHRADVYHTYRDSLAALVLFLKLSGKLAA
jgi:hypothetical protein